MAGLLVQICWLLTYLARWRGPIRMCSGALKGELESDIPLSYLKKKKNKDKWKEKYSKKKIENIILIFKFMKNFSDAWQ